MSRADAPGAGAAATPPARSSRRELARGAARIALAVAMVWVGVLHFTSPAPFVRIVPPWLAWPLGLVWLSGAAEIALGLGLLVPHDVVRRWTGVGLVALYVAVFPANVHMAVNDVQLDPASPLPAWVGWARLPFQLVFIAWAWWVTRPREPVASRRDP